MKSIQFWSLGLVFVWSAACAPDVSAFLTDEERARRMEINRALNQLEASSPTDELVERRTENSRDNPAATEHTYYSSDGPAYDVEALSSEDSRAVTSASIAKRLKEAELDRTQFRLAIVPMRYRYEEPGVMKQDGMLWGAYAAYTFRLRENQPLRNWRDVFSATNTVNTFRLEAMHTVGKVDFEGQNIGSRPERDNKIFDIRVLAGYDIPVHSRLTMTPYIGMGFHHTYDDSPGRLLPFSSFRGAREFRRKSDRGYVPVGIDAVARLGNGWAATLNLEYDWIFWGRQTNFYGDIGPIINDGAPQLHVLDNIQYPQDSGYGLRGSLELTKQTRTVDFFIQPFVHYWFMKPSDDVQFTSYSGSVKWFDGSGIVPRSYIQPRSESAEVGMKLGVIF